MRPSEARPNGVQRWAQPAFSLINKSGLDSAVNEIGEALHTVQDSYAHTTRDNSETIIAVQCFTCSKLLFTGAHTHSDPEASDNRGSLTAMGQGAATASAAFLQLMKQAGSMNHAEFNQALGRYLNQYFKKRIEEREDNQEP